MPKKLDRNSSEFCGRTVERNEKQTQCRANNTDPWGYREGRGQDQRRVPATRDHGADVLSMAQEVWRDGGE